MSSNEAAACSRCNSVLEDKFNIPYCPTCNLHCLEDYEQVLKAIGANSRFIYNGEALALCPCCHELDAKELAPYLDKSPNLRTIDALRLDDSESCATLNQILTLNNTISALCINEFTGEGDDMKLITDGLSCCPDLHTLSFVKCAMNAAVSEHLGLFISKSKTLTTLKLTPTEPNELCCGGISRGIKKNSSLTDLTLWKINSSDIKWLLEALIDSPSFKKIELAYINLTQTAAMFTELVKKSQTWEEITLICCECASEAMTMIAEALALNTSLKRFKIHYGRDDGINHTARQLLYSGISRNKSLQTMDVNRVNIRTAIDADEFKTMIELIGSVQEFRHLTSNVTATELKALSEALVASKTLRGFTCHCINSATDEDPILNYFAEPLRVNTTLETFRLSDANRVFGEEGLVAFCEALKVNQTLQTVTIKCKRPEKVSIDSTAIIDEMMRVNESLAELQLTEYSPSPELSKEMKKRNEALEIRRKIDTPRIIRDIAANWKTCPNHLPIELWISIFEHLSYPRLGHFGHIARKIFKEYIVS